MSRAVRIAHAVLLFLQVVLGATVLTEFVESRWIGLGNILVVAAHAALEFYRRPQVPTEEAAT